jgi:hypothetical protein
VENVESKGMCFDTESDVLQSLSKAADLLSQGLMTGEQAQGIAGLADIALCAIRQREPAKYGFYAWNQHPLYGPYGSTMGQR